MRSKEIFQKAVHNWPVKILAVAAALVLFLFNRISSLEERFFSVPVTMIVDDGFMPAAVYPRQIRVTLRGDDSSVFLILEDDIHAVVDFSGYKKEGVFKAPIIIQKTGTALEVDPLDIRTDPMELTIPLEKKISKYLEIEPVLEGIPSPGYEVIQTFVSPVSVSVEGPRTHIDKLFNIKTQPIDVTGKKDDFSARVRLDSPDPLLRIRGSDIVEFRANMEEALIVKTYENVSIVSLGLDLDLRIISTFPEGKITVQGGQVLQETLRSEQVRLIVDISHLSQPGSYVLPVRPDLPSGVVVLGYEPEHITVQVEKGSAGSERSSIHGSAEADPVP